MTPNRRALLAAAPALALAGCATAGIGEYPRVGRIERLDPSLDALIDISAPIDRLADGFSWAEGPVWLGMDGGVLLFSDVPRNRIHRWSARDGVSVWMEPSGYAEADAAGFREAGSNGLIAGSAGVLLAADHGARGLSAIDLRTRAKTTLADRFQGKRFNSPNDLVMGRDGAIWFTDPPYGLEGLHASPLKELPFSGIYRLAPDGTVGLIDWRLSFPNGIALSPDGRTLYVANSDPKRAIIVAYGLGQAGAVESRRVFADLTAQVGAERPGLPDGMKVDVAGNVWATGPGGVHVFAADGRALGRIDPGTATANCGFGEDGSTLFLTAGSTLCRVRTKTRGLGV